MSKVPHDLNLSGRIAHIVVLDFWFSLSDWLGVRHRNRICYYNLRSYIRRTLQSCHYNLLRNMARFSLEKGPSLHLCTGFRRFHGWLAARWPIPSSVDGTGSRIENKRRKPQLSGRSRVGIVFFPRAYTDQLWISALH